MIRPVAVEDLPSIVHLVVAAGMFAPADAGIVEDLVTAHLAAGGEDGHGCLVDDDGGVVGVAYHQPRGIADGVSDLTMIAVAPHEQGRGRGAALLARVEDELRGRGRRLLLVETSGTEAYAGARRFYAARGYDEEARIRDLWAPGDDLVVFRKALGGSP